ncbi:hypothetical protein FOA52_005239 [Chlamydomonas sp. UWO 241]|nr:hypothetical protein FOA52_005239 [Chlamydomonas sp. UWO 241]
MAEEASAVPRPPVDPAALEEAEKAKEEANLAFKEKHYTRAIEGYTRAIEFNPTSAVYYSNRAICHIKLEAYGAAISDATKAIEQDPAYVKAYYRRGDANFAMGKFKAALRDLRLAAKVVPSDAGLRKKLSECEKEVKRQKFEDALATPDELVVLASSQIVLEDMPVEDGYKGPRMSGSQANGYTIDLEFVKAMLASFKEQKLIHKRFAYEIIMTALELFRQQPALVDVPVADDGHFTVCGDVHGQFYDLCNIWELNGPPSESNPYLFNGDFVDRGSFSVEVILALLAFKCLYPSSMFLSRGNHESKNMNKIYGFDGEVKAKYSQTMVEVFRDVFNAMPLAYVINKRVLVLHGGLFSRDDVTLDDLRAIDRFHEPPDEGLMCEMLWSDPSPVPGRTPSKRGVGVAFGPDVTRKFLEHNKLDLLIRSHEVKENGYEVEHNGQLATVFSAPNYCDQMGNKGAYVRFNGHDMVPHFTTFDAVPHPAVKPMQYANQFMQM